MTKISSQALERVGHFLPVSRPTFSTVRIALAGVKLAYTHSQLSVDWQHGVDISKVLATFSDFNPKLLKVMRSVRGCETLAEKSLTPRQQGNPREAMATALPPPTFDLAEGSYGSGRRLGASHAPSYVESLLPRP